MWRCGLGPGGCGSTRDEWCWSGWRMRNKMRSGARHTDHGLNMRDVYSHSQSHISASRSLWLVVVHRNSARFCYPPLVRDRESDRLTKGALVWTRYKSPCSLLKPQPSAQMCTCAEAAKAVGSRHARPRRTRHAERGARPRPALWLPRALVWTGYDVLPVGNTYTTSPCLFIAS